MKKAILFILPTIFLFSSCKKDQDFLFEMEYFVDFTIPSGLNSFGTHIFEIENINSNAAAYLSQNNRSEADIANIAPGNSFLEAIFQDGDFSYIREVSIKMFSNDDPTYEKEIFYHNIIPENQSGNLQLIGTLVDAKEFLVEEKINIRIELRLRNISPESVDTRLNFSFFAQ